jgi:YgiT-type zinc finger domain-containing protein
MKIGKTKPPEISCPLCKGLQFRKKCTTYPMRMFDGRQLNIGRVSVHECKKCGHLVPTKAGAAKIDRCFATMAPLFF